MRITEIINESISYSRLHRPLVSVITDKVFSLSDATSDELIRELEATISVFLKKHTRLNIIVRFIEGARADGSAESFHRPTRHYIEINYNHIKRIQNDILSNNTVGINDIIFHMASVVIHELVHIKQHRQQFNNKRKETEYRSYIVKDKDKFDRDLKSSWLSKAYLSSPQEISAISHDIAIDFIKEQDIDTWENIEFLKVVLPKRLEQFIISKLSDYDFFRKFSIKNHEDNKVFKRYSKLVYQEVTRYIDSIKK
jgi:hypothetical protein